MWKEVALTLDEYLHFNDWKRVDEDAYYDWKLVKKVDKCSSTFPSFIYKKNKVRRSLRTLREAQDVRGCLGVLETCIRSNFAGVESPRYVSTRHYVSSY